MGLSKNLTEISEQLDLDLQLMASELDTSAKGMRYLSSDLMEDQIVKDCFIALCEDIESGEGDEVASIDENTVLYEFMDEAVLIHSNLSVKYVIFDIVIAKRMENRLSSYR